MVPGWMENPGKSVAGVSLAIITRTHGGAEDASVGPASMDSMNVNGTGKRLTRRRSVVHHLSHGQSSGHIRLINIEPTGQWFHLSLWPPIHSWPEISRRDKTREFLFSLFAQNPLGYEYGVPCRQANFVQVDGGGWSCFLRIPDTYLFDKSSLYCWLNEISQQYSHQPDGWPFTEYVAIFCCVSLLLPIFSNRVSDGN